MAMRAELACCLATAWSWLTSLVGLARQNKLRNPRFKRHCTSLGPMKPLAPVIRIGSSGPIMKWPSSVCPAFPLLDGRCGSLIVLMSLSMATQNNFFFHDYLSNKVHEAAG